MAKRKVKWIKGTAERGSSLTSLLTGCISCWLVICFAGCASSRPSADDLEWLTRTSATQVASSGAKGGEGSALELPRHAVRKEPVVVRPGNSVSLSSLEDPSLNGRFRVRLNGTVDLPYAKRVPVVGLTTSALESKLRETYRPFFKGQDVDLVVRIIDKEVLVDVRGLVLKPGKYTIESETSLDELIAKAGGFVTGEKRPGFVIVRKGEETRSFNLNTYFGSGHGGDLPLWMGGETITFLADAGLETPRDAVPTVRILGEVRQPGEIAHVEGADLYHYLTVAGGPTTFADLERIELVRGQDQERRSLKLDANGFSRYVKIQNGDLIIVHSNQTTTFERRLQVATGLGTLLSSMVLLLVTLL